MPDIIRSSSIDSAVVATISSVADQSTLNAVSPTVSATINSLPATITAWAWKVNGVTTGVTGPTTATPSYTPTTAGAKVITVDVTINGVVYSSLPEIFTVGPTALSVSVATPSAQLGLTAATLDSTVTGGVTPYTYAWTVDGATTGLSSSTAADPTYTPTAAGTPTAVVTVTDAAGQVAKAAVTWTVGDADGRVQTHAVDWTAAGVAGTKTIGSSETLDGISISYGTSGGGSPSYVAGATGLVVTPNGAGSLSLEWSATDLGAVTMNTKDDVVWYVALDASIGTGGSDYTTLPFLDSTGNDRVVAQIGYNAGSYFVRASRRLAGVTTQYEKAVASQVRQIALRFSDGLLAEVRYSLSAFSGTFPAFSSMTPVYTTNTSNCFTAYDPVAATDTAPKPAQSGSILRLTTQGSARTYARTEIRRRQAPGT